MILLHWHPSVRIRRAARHGIAVCILVASLVAPTAAATSEAGLRGEELTPARPGISIQDQGGENIQPSANGQASDASLLQNPASSDAIRVFMAGNDADSPRSIDDTGWISVFDSLSVIFTFVLLWLIAMILLIWKRHQVSKFLRIILYC